MRAFGGKMTFRGTIKIEQEEDWIVATCFENNVASQGKTIDEAINNLKEAIMLYYEDETNKEELNFLQNEQVLITRLEMAL
jgi:predicted RNase H-like HicB family nuclease